MSIALVQPSLFDFVPPAPPQTPVERALHVHSLQAQGAKAGELKGRKAAILAWMRENGPATDRRVRDAMFGDGSDMNMVRPRISELIASWYCHEIGSIVDDVTGLHVRLVRAKTEMEVRLEGIG